MQLHFAAVTVSAINTKALTSINYVSQLMKEYYFALFATCGSVKPRYSDEITIPVS